MILTRVALPAIDDETFQFTFNATLASGTLDFTFKWLNSMWNLFVAFPDGSVREAGVFPGAVSWSGFPAYRLIFLSPYEKIDRQNIQLSSMFVLDLING